MSSIDPSSTSDPSLTILTWNIQVGNDAGPLHNGWPKRKDALKGAIQHEKADIVCLQEVSPDQLKFLAKGLPQHKHVAVPRDDGKIKGESCAIFFKSPDFEQLSYGTFWLSDTPQNCHSTWDGFFKRICTWVTLRHTESGRKLSVFNTHFPLNPLAHEKSAILTIQRMSSICHLQNCILTGDFNCKPDSTGWSRIEGGGLKNAETLAGHKALSPTRHVNGKPVACIDAIFVSPELIVTDYKVLSKQYKEVWPSDHFGLVSKVLLKDFLCSTPRES